jgi:glycosyltransferase involved in cell wall biosynthesis
LDIKLVLTCTLEPDPKAFSIFRNLKCKDRIIFKPRVSDDVLVNLYQNAALLCFTSLAEGNFPPQIQEAIFYRTPVVASNLEFVTERIPNAHLDKMILCEPNNLEDFVKSCEFVLHNRDLIIERQHVLRELFLKRDESLDFHANLKLIFS